jgi:hypothetical protein
MQLAHDTAALETGAGQSQFQPDEDENMADDAWVQDEVI